MIPCKTVATLLSSDQLSTQSFWTRLRVQFHLRMCKYCSRLARQLEQLRSAARRLADAADQESAGRDLESRILRKISGDRE